VFEIDGRSLTLEQVERAARTRGANVRLSEQARTVMAASRARVDEIVATGETVYGVTTGFGHFAEVSISPDAVRELQINLVRSHAVGTGEELAPEVVRALLVLRANVMARGCSGVRPVVVEQMLGLHQGIWRRWRTWRWCSSARARPGWTAAW